MTVRIQPIVLVTDFGDGIFAGQIRARLGHLLPGSPVVDLVHDLPPFRADLAAYLLPALIRDMPGGAIYVCVVDPGVGGARGGLLVRARDCWFIGPDNGLLAPLVRSAEGASVDRIGWCPAVLSASFHGRDWFAPAAARLSAGADLQLTPIDPAEMIGSDWPCERAAVVYVDRFGNLMTGLRASTHCATQSLRVGTRALPHARTFCEVMPGEAFWYENALGLVEIAVNQGRADQLLALSPGDSVGPFTHPD
jgi:S-adenosyl-L-methionine hydrolase (adenosine-forming)